MMTETNCNALIQGFSNYVNRYLSADSGYNVQATGVLADLTFSNGISLDQASATEGNVVSPDWIGVQSSVPELPGSYTLGLTRDDGSQSFSRFAVPKRKNDLLVQDSGIFAIVALAGQLATEVTQDLGIVPADGKSLKTLARECAATYGLPIDETVLAAAMDIYFIEPDNYTLADADSKISFSANGNIQHTVAVGDPRQSFGSAALIAQGIGKGTFSGSVSFGCVAK